MQDAEESFDGMFLVNELCIENSKIAQDALIRPDEQKIFD